MPAQRSLPFAASLEVVVARYDESVAWTKNLPAGVRATIYDKGPPPVAEGHLPLPNIGREAHSYLQHIVQRYDSLAPLTFFCQGKPFDHAPDLHRRVRAAATVGPEEGTGFCWLGFMADTDDARGRRLFVPWSKNRDGRELPVGEFYQDLFGEPAPEEFRFRPGGQFAARDSRIRFRSLDFYRRALALSIERRDAAHCFERIWDAVFGVVGVDPAAMGGQTCLYEKPIRRLLDQQGAKR